MPRIQFANGSFPFLLGVFLICMCGLMLQITETRVMSVIAFYHMAVFAISMAFSINTSLWLGGLCYILIAPIAAHLLLMTRQGAGELSGAARAEAH